MNIDSDTSHSITERINKGDLSTKPGWVRLSLHPTMSNAELEFVAQALTQIAEHHKEWEKDYIYNPYTNEFKHKDEPADKTNLVEDWFNV